MARVQPPTTHVIQLRLGDCIELLKQIDPETIGAVITDPPYGLEFMGKDWDAPWKTGAGMCKPGIGKREISWPSFGGATNLGSANPTCDTCGGRLRGAKQCGCDEPEWRVAGEPVEDGTKGVSETLKQRHAFQAWCRLWLDECFRVLKPGGVIKVFGGTRMYHRMAQAMAEAGFTNLELEAWAYGCLTDDAEILTENGWKLGVDITEGEQVACWNPSTGEIHLGPVEEVILAPFEGEMVAFRNHNTDQLLTPNHRVYKKGRVRAQERGIRTSRFEAEWSIEQASVINRWNPVKLPLAGSHSGTGIGGRDWARLLGWIWTEGGFDQKGTGVRIWQSSVNMEHVEEIQTLLDELAPDHKLYTRDRAYKDRTYTEYCWFFSGEVALRVRDSLPEKRPTWALLWGMTAEEKIGLVDAALKGDGSCNRGRWAFYQKHPDDLVWFQTLAHLMNRQGRINFQKNLVGLHMNPTTELQSRHLKAAETELYRGDVWCVRVPTGAFVARRNDQVFITGNSGFPKSLNISKAIDRHLGKQDEREVVGSGKAGAAFHYGNPGEGGFGTLADKGGGTPSSEWDVTAAASDEAKRFEGWGTALKPAWEPFIVGRKPDWRDSGVTVTARIDVEDEGAST